MKIIILCILLFLILVQGVQAADTDTFVTKWGTEGSGDGQFYNPFGIAVDSSGDIYVAESQDIGGQNHRIQKFSSDGTFLLKWGSKGSSDGQFDYPEGVAVDSSGNVYVTDANNRRIQKFSSDGTFLLKWGSLGSGDGQFVTPQGVAVDLSGNVYVVDYGNKRIQKFSSTGTFLTKWGTEGSGDGQFSNPWGIAVDSSDNVYVVDRGNNRIQKFSSTGTFLTKWYGGFHYPQDVAVDSLGNVYVSDEQNHRIQKFSSDGTFLLKWGSQGSGDSQFKWPGGVAVDSLDNVYVVDNGNHRIQKFDNTSASFTGTPTSGVPPLAVQFTGSSNRLSITSWDWSFGDGSVATVQNPLHTYTSEGTYTVSLIATNASGSNTATVANYIKSFNPASFRTSFINSSGYATNTSPVGVAPFTVTFNDTSSIKPNAWQWNFQGGVPSSSTLPNNTVVYNNPGTFNASLTVTNGSVTATSFKSISVSKNSAVNQTTVTVGDVTAGDSTTVNDSTSGVVIKITPSKSSNANTLTVAVFNESAPPQEFANTVPLVGKKVYDFASSISNGDITSVNINITYTDADLAASGFNENNLGIYYYNENTGAWEKLTTGGIDTTNKVVWGTTSHLSIYGISGSSSSSSSGTNPGLDSSSDSYNPASFASTAGATKTEIVNVGGGSAVTRAEMTGTGLGKNLVITSMPRSNLPTTMAAPPTTVYQYMSITSSTITGVVSETSMEFNVPQSWLTEHSYTVNDIVMMRNVDGKWQTLNTQLVSQKAGTVFYRATTPGFSYFAIAYQKGGTTIGTGTPVPTKLAVAAASLTNTPAPVYSKSPVAIGPTDTQIVPSGPVISPINGMPLTTIVVGVIGAIAIIIGAFYVRRGLIRRQNPALFRKYD